MFVLRHAMTRRNMMNIHKLRVNRVGLAHGAVRRVVTALIVVSATHAALAANCVEQPNLQTAQGGHWYYYKINSITHRKCWFLHQQQPSTESSAAEPKPTVEGDSSLSSFLSSLFDRQAGVSSAVTASAPSAEPVAKRSTSPSYERRWLLRAKPARLSQVHQPELERGRQQDQIDSAQREALFERFLRWAAREGQAPFRQDAAGSSESP
jgi:hypothetical protein